MNAASQLLRVLAILGAIAAGVLFYMSNGKIAGLKSDLESAKSQAASAKTTADKTIADANAQLTSDAQVVADLKKQLNTAKSDESLANDRFNSLKDDSESKDAAVKDAQAKAKDLQDQLDKVSDATSKVADLQKQLDDATKKLDEANSTIEQMKTAPVTQNTAQNTPGSSLPQSTAPVVPKSLSSPMPATVLQLDSKNWLLAIDAGADKGMKNDSVLYIKVGQENLAIVKVLDTTPTLATASVLSTEDVTPSQFASIVKQGLQVTYQTEVAQQ